MQVVGHTALHIALKYDHVKLAIALVKLGADINFANKVSM